VLLYIYIYDMCQKRGEEEGNYNNNNKEEKKRTRGMKVIRNDGHILQSSNFPTKAWRVRLE